MDKQYIIINLGENRYGIQIDYIYNIIVMQNITRVPKSQPYFKGVINLRGEVIPVMSLRSRLGLSEVDYTSVTRIIIVKPEPQAAPVGIIVDEVMEVITLNESQIKMNYDEKDEKGNLSIGIGQQGDVLINLLNIQGIVS